MRKLVIWIGLLALILVMPVRADAASAAKSVSIYATVAPDESCQVTLTATVHLDEPAANLYFPLSGAAEQITLNGSQAKYRTENGLKYVDLTTKSAGDHTFTLAYTLPDVIATNKAGQQELRLPILSGFPYPVQALEFSVTLPGAVSAKPAFSSGYHQANIEKDLYFQTNGGTVSGIAQTELKDHETLSMTLTVPAELFPPPLLAAPDYQTASLLIAGFALLALVYWIIFLRNAPFWPGIHPTPPEGCSAGEVGSLLHLQKGKLSLMIYSWAELGYLLIQLEPGGRVMLHKQMDMGNERSVYEQRCFKMLFGNHSVIDTGSIRYIETCRAVRKMRPNLGHMIHRRSGSILIFRLLAALSGCFCGAYLGITFSNTNEDLLWPWVLCLGAVALLSSWHIQGCISFTPGKRRLWHGLLLGILWIVVALAAGNLFVGPCLVLGQFLAGLLTSFGGRRTLAGRQTANEILGLRRHLKTVSAPQLQQLCQNDPEYFHRMMPYALALGVDTPFAARFGKAAIPPCPYIYIGTEPKMDAAQWRSIMVRILKVLRAHETPGLAGRLSGLFRLFIR